MKGFTHGDPRATAAGKAGGRASGQKRLQQAIDRVREKWPGMPEDAARVIYEYGENRYNAGWIARKRADQRVEDATCQCQSVVQ